MSSLLLASTLGDDEVRWLILGLTVMAFLCGIAAAVMSILVNRKKLKEAPPSEVTKTIITNGPMEIREVVEYVTKPEFQEFSNYVHKRNHKLDDALHTLGLTSEERRQVADENFKEIRRELNAVMMKLDEKRSNTAKDLYENLKKAELKLAAVEADAKTHTRQLDHISQQLSLLVKRKA